MLPADLLEMLRCPQTRQRVTLAEAGTLESINQSIREGRCLNQAGQAVSEPVDGALVTEDRSRFYPVRNLIPVMLPDEAIPLS